MITVEHGRKAHFLPRWGGLAHATDYLHEVKQRMSLPCVGTAADKPFVLRAECLEGGTVGDHRFPAGLDVVQHRRAMSTLREQRINIGDPIGTRTLLVAGFVAQVVYEKLLHDRFRFRGQSSHEAEGLRMR